MLTLYFDIFSYRFPLDNKLLLQEWTKLIKLPNWQPSKTAKICSDHFENEHIEQIDDKYKLVDFAIPSIQPKVYI